MKKSVLFLAAALVILSLFMSSYTKPKAHEESCEGRFTLEHDLVTRMTQKYKRTQLNLINRRFKSRFKDGKGDAKEIWFSLDVLKEFICQVENEPALEGKNLGVRIYYAAYPKRSEWGLYSDLADVPRSYAERHTLVLIPTSQERDGLRLINQDYIPQQGDVLAVPLYYTTGIGDIELEEERLAKNHGGLVPPGG